MIKVPRIGLPIARQAAPSGAILTHNPDEVRRLLNAARTIGGLDDITGAAYTGLHPDDYRRCRDGQIPVPLEAVRRMVYELAAQHGRIERELLRVLEGGAYA